MLEIIKEEYYWAVANLTGYELNMKLLFLMAELEIFYGTLKANPTAEELKDPARVLYLKIAQARSRVSC